MSLRRSSARVSSVRVPASNGHGQLDSPFRGVPRKSREVWFRMGSEIGPTAEPPHEALPVVGTGSAGPWWRIRAVEPTPSQPLACGNAGEDCAAERRRAIFEARARVASATDVLMVRVSGSPIPLGRCR